MSDFQSFSNPGRKGKNQDSVLICKSDTKTLIAIADGMGGNEAGEHASKIAIESLEKAFNKNTAVNFTALFAEIKDKLSVYADEHGIEKMGTTLTACLIIGTTVTVAHVGDTRLYHLRNDGIKSITRDQTEVQQLMDEGVLTKKRAERYHRRNILLSAITNYSDYTLSLRELVVNDGDRLLLFTDGAYNLIQKVEVRDISVNKIILHEMVDEVLRLIESREIKDDYSLVAYEI
jgi:protein phosphatase